MIVSARTAPTKHGPEGASASGATAADTEEPRLVDERPSTRTSPTTSATLRSDGNGLGDPRSERVADTSLTEPSISLHHPDSPPSDEPTGGSTKRYRTPGDALAFARQLNSVATRVLNGDLDLETGRVFGALARSEVQALGTHVTLARLGNVTPDLTLGEDGVFEEDE